jgi:hypothetical protein
LCKPGKEEKELLPTTTHGKRFVRRVAMLKKGLRKQGQVPVKYKK